MPTSSPGLRTFLAEWHRQIAMFLLAERHWPQSLGLVIATTTIAVALPAWLIGGFCALLLQVLGQARLNLAFPYLHGVLQLWAWPALSWLLLALPLLAALALGRLSAGLPGNQRRRWWILAGLLSLLVLATAVDVAFTEGNGAVMEALNARSGVGFWSSAGGLGAIYLLTLPLQYLSGYGQQCFALCWRATATAALQRRYLQHHAYEHLERQAQGRLDNPDQRLADDVNRAVFSSTQLLFGFATTLLSLAAYVVVLWGISGWLVLTLAVATLLGNGAMLRLVRRLAGLNVRQQALEADYRFALMHLRSHAEGVALLRGERAIGLGLGQRLRRLLRNLERVIRWRELVSQSSALYAFVMQFVPYLVLASAYFSGRLGLGALTVGSIAFGQVQTSLSFLIDQADAFASLFASLHRLSEMDAACASAAGPTPLAAPLAAGGQGTPPVRITHLCVARPQGPGALIQELTLQLDRGQRLLITGPSGAGKTSLLRVLAGVMPPLSGVVTMPPGRAWMLLPQTPVLPLGSLRDQLCFPRSSTAASDARLRELLTQVGLADLSARYASLDAVEDWARVLSGGEQQRLSMTRVLLHRPQLALLDEATSATDLASEQHLYALLLTAGVTLISVGHRPSLRQFHQRELQLDGRGGWRLLTISS